MYSKPFFIEDPVWNNALSFDKRQNKKLYVTNLVKREVFSVVELWNQIVFEDFDFSWRLISAKWLKNFYEFEYQNTPLYLFDNHNHAFYFWYKSYFNKKISKNALLLHIDEHSDLRIPDYIPKNINSLKEAFEYTNFSLNVWNYIIPAIRTWLIKKDFQIRSEEDIRNFLIKKDELFKEFYSNIILNIDLDFFAPELDYIDYNIKRDIIKECIKYSNIITVSTSPFFIDGKKALDVFMDIFNS